MKKTYLIIVLLSSFIILFTNIDVQAAKKRLATCTYKTSAEKINGVLEGVNIVVDVYDDESVKAKINLGNWSDTPSTGDLISNTDFYQQFDRNTFKKNGEFYKKFKEDNTCPKMQFIFYLNTSQLHFNVGGGRVSDNLPNETVTPIITNKDDSVLEEEIICEKTSVLDTDEEITVKFYKVGNKNMFSVDEGPRGSHVAEENGIAVGNISSYRIREEDKKIYWDKNKCKESKLYVARTDSVSNDSFTFQTIEPDELANAAGNNSCENAGKGGCLPEGGKGEAVTDICGIFTSDMIDLAKKIVGYVQIGTVFLALVLGILDFVGAIGSDKDNAFKDAGKKFLKRLIAVALVFLVPALLGIILNFISVANECNVEIFG